MNDHLKIPRVLWSALLTAAVLFCGGSFLPLHSYFNTATPPAIAAPAFCLTAVVDIVLSFVFPRIQYQAWAQRNLKGLVTSEPDPTADKLFKKAAPEIKVLRVDRPMLRKMILPWQSSFIISAALSESVALIGGLLSILGFDLVWSAPLGLAGVVLILIRWPSERSVLGPVERAVGARVVLDLASSEAGRP